MVVLLDLEEDGPEDARHLPANDDRTYFQHQTEQTFEQPVDIHDRPDPDNSAFSRSVACYPIASELARCLDLNSLHELSRTNRQIRANLLQFRTQLINHTLRCENEIGSKQIGDRLVEGLRGAMASWSTFGHNGVQTGRITSGKVGLCARDMVGECRKCGRIVCRNCVVKQPPRNNLNDRHRRVCRTCLRVPLEKHTSFTIEHIDDEAHSSPDVFTYQAFARDPCNCTEHVWICQPCGQSLRTDDVTYVRGWDWRKRYSTRLGGPGAGLGEGSEGVTCGRKSTCLASYEVEKEIDCPADDLAIDQAEAEKARLEGRSRSGIGFFMQEIEGIGGVMKKKVKKRERVGRVVKEYEDERENGGYLSREKAGANRSWCSWCNRVIPSKGDLESNEHDSLDRVVSSSSSSSPSLR